MKIAMLLPSLSNTGPGIVVRELCTEFISKGHECKVFYFDDIIQLQMPCPVERINFREAIDFAHWDIVHSNMLRPDGYVWYHASRNHIPHATKLVTTLHQPISFKALHTNYGMLQSLIGSCLWGKFISTFMRIVVLNSDTATELSGKIDTSKVEVIHNGRNIPIKREVANKKDKELLLRLKNKYKIIGTVSSITKRKGLYQMIEALPYLPDFAFVAVGAGDQLDGLKQRSIELGCSERCLWVGYRDDATEYLSMFDMFVMCTYSEGFPLALIEAAAYGLPTVLSDIPILKSIMSDEQVAFYQLENIKDLASKIQQAYREREKYSRNIRSHYEQHLTATAMADNYLKLYSDINFKSY